MADLRVILWDIDGTLLHSRRRGAFTGYMAPAMRRVFGTAGRLEEMVVSGMTDLQIFTEALAGEGFTAEQVRERLPELTGLFVEGMERMAAEGDLFTALPGARAALEALEREPRYLNSLLTGNVEPAARLKLRVVGLDRFFSQLPGAFGELSHDRRDLPAVARERISRHLNRDLTPGQLVVIGDTPNDIACARHFGARAVAVATGRMHTAEELRRHDPDAVLPGLEDTALLLRTLSEL